MFLQKYFEQIINIIVHYFDEFIYQNNEILLIEEIGPYDDLNFNQNFYITSYDGYNGYDN